MPSAFAFIVPASGSPVYFDCVVSETHENKSTLTEHPVEVGSDVSDNVRHDPEVISLEGTITNTPIDGPNSALALTVPQGPANPTLLSVTGLLSAGLSALGGLLFGSPTHTATVQVYSTPFDNITATHNALTYLERTGILCDVHTSTKVYDSMICTGVNMPREMLGSADFKVEFRRINIVATATVAAPVPLIKAAVPPQAKGPQTPKGFFDPSSQSLLSSGKDAASNALAKLTGG